MAFLDEIDYNNTSIDRRGNYLDINYIPDYLLKLLKLKETNKPNNIFQRPYTAFNPNNENLTISQKFKKYYNLDNNEGKKIDSFVDKIGAANPAASAASAARAAIEAPAASAAQAVQAAIKAPAASAAAPADPADAVLKWVNMLGDVTSGALSALAKPGSKGSAYAEGSQMAQSIVKPLENIPIVGQASKLISGIIGGALGARKQGIRNKEEDKQFKLTEYLDRNLITATTPSYYGQYHAKYGANPKMMEQRIIDDIYSDFDKYLKIV